MKMKKILALIIPFFLFFGIAPVVAHAEEPEQYDLLVGGVSVTSENMSDVFGDGTVSYDRQTKTLTLNNASIEGQGQIIMAAGIYSADSLTIRLIGNNYVRSSTEAAPIEPGWNEAFCGIYCENESYETKLTIIGEGTLDVYACSYSKNNSAVGLNVHSLDIKDATVNVLAEVKNVSSVPHLSGIAMNLILYTESGTNYPGVLNIEGGTLTLKCESGVAFFQDGSLLTDASAVITASKNLDGTESEIWAYESIDLSFENLTKYKYLQIHNHVYSEDWTSDEEWHWHACSCGDKKNVAAHETALQGARSASCFEEGYTGDTVCTVCKKVTEKGKTIPKTAHGETELQNVKTATCTQTGYTGDKVCKVCGTVV